MNPLRWPFRAQFFLGFLICAGLLGYAIFLQLKMGLEPCPLCIFQRITVVTLGFVFLILQPCDEALPSTHQEIVDDLEAVVGVVPGRALA